MSATSFNVQISPTFCEQCMYVCMYVYIQTCLIGRLLKAAIIHVRRFFAYMCAYLRMCVFAHLGIRRFIYMLALVLGTKLTTQLQKKQDFFKTGIVLLKRLILKPISVLDLLTLLAEKIVNAYRLPVAVLTQVRKWQIWSCLSDLMKMCVKLQSYDTIIY